MAIKHKMGNDFDPFVEGANRNFGYQDNALDFPEYDNVDQHSGIKPEGFYEVYKGTPGFSEINAIRLYTSDSAKYDSLSTLFFGVALVEMLLPPQK
jgi:hypothetical protein